MNCFKSASIKLVPLLIAAAGLFSAYSCGRVSGRFASVAKDSPYQKKCDCMRIVSYNVGAFGKYIPEVQANVDMVAAMLAEAGADAVTLNELDSLNRRHPVYELEMLAEALGGWEYSFARAMPYKGGAYGNGVALPSGTEILARYTVSLPKGKDKETRSIAVVETAEYVIGAVHLGLDPDVQLEQVAVVDSWAEARYEGCGKPVFLCGDMNAVPGSATLAALEKNWERLSSEENSFDSRNPEICIDHIFRYRSSAPVEVLGAGTMTSFKKGDAASASDHFPIYVDVAF